MEHTIKPSSSHRPKRPRHPNEPEGSTAISNPPLPAELWAHSLQFLFFDEVLPITSQNSIFYLPDVSSEIKTLHVRNSHNLRESSENLKQFENVDNINVFSLIEKSEDQPAQHGRNRNVTNIHLDVETIENFIPFISRFPKLSVCFVGGLSTDPDFTYSLHGDQRFDVPDHHVQLAKLIESVCQGYLAGDISMDVTLHGVVGYHGRRGCYWRSQLQEISSYRNDVFCQICDMICTCFPPPQVMNFCDSQIPCISKENRFQIAKFRDLKRYKLHATNVLLWQLGCSYGAQLMHLPASPEKKLWVYHYLDNVIEDIRWLIEMGADCKDPRMRQKILERNNERENSERSRHEMMDGFDKRPILLSSYNHLTDLGFDVHMEDFVILRECGESESQSLTPSSPAEIVAD
ncbi:hypothetical protein ACHAXS_013943 [Conticribra weissflogii]